MRFKRAAGILLHPTSLPGPYGIGMLGREAYRFVEWMEKAGMELWQVMPLGPTSFGDSPYQCFSAFAGNPLLIDLDRLASEGFLTRDDLQGAPARPDLVDYGPVIGWKMPILEKAWGRWKRKASQGDREHAERFRTENAGWLEDFALFMALKAAHGGAAWCTWAPELRRRDGAALAEARKQHGATIDFHCWLQYQFAKHWLDLKKFANKKRIRIIGDIPIFVAYDSADCWANPDLFHLDAEGHLTVVAGVPPDYFSPTGQRWGNPLYRWDALAKTGYRWWIERFSLMLKLCDIIRIDHFRGFEAYWEVPASEPTAIKGRWVKGPGMEIFRAVQDVLGDLPIIAEDLGVITEEVEALRDASGFPGMRVLQFAYGSNATDPYLPHNFIPHTVVYTGTHDNDTSEGWFASAPEKEKQAFWDYVGPRHSTVHWEIIRLAVASVADIALVPMQDVLGLGAEARMNTPGRESGNWGWRLDGTRLDDGLATALKDLVVRYGRGQYPARKKVTLEDTTPR